MRAPNGPRPAANVAMKPRSSSPATPRHVRPPSAIDAAGRAPAASPAGVVVVVVVVVGRPPANVAETLAGAVSVTVQAPVPAQRPFQPVKEAERPGTADSRTAVPTGNRAVQRPGHEIPTGLLVTVPAPVTVTVNATSSALPPVDVNVALTTRSPLIDTVQI